MHWRSQAKRATVWLVGLSVVLASVAVAYGGTPHRAEPGRLDAVRDDPDVVVDERPGRLVVRDADPAGEQVGLVFYPGARVEPEAYLWTLAALVERTDVRVVVPRMPLNLAVLDPGRAGGVMANHPDIDRWLVGGHSLGGAMACQFATNNPDRVAGVVLLAAYCPQGSDSEETSLPMLAVWGARDGVLDRGPMTARNWAPETATFVRLDGVNHAQMGAYGSQPGDREPTVPDRVARRRLTAAVVDWLDNRSSSRVAAPGASAV